MQTILILEGEAQDAEHLRQYLLSHGFDVTGIVKTAEEALTAIEARLPSLIITDVMLSGEMDGIEFATLVDERFGIPVIYLTACRDERFIERARQSPPCAYLIKPFNENELDLTIEMAIRRYQIRRDMDTALKKAEQANTTKSEFISRLNHELCSPLNAIIGFSHLLQTEDQATLTAGQQESINEITRAGNHMLGLIKQVLELGRLETGRQSARMTVVDLNAVVHECIDILRPETDAGGIKMINNISDAPPLSVAADKTGLKDVLTSLIGNAIKFNRENGSVTIDAGVKPGGIVHLSVTDTGVGVSEADSSKIFAPFVQLGDSPVKGSGLGLAISRQLVQLMGGDIGYQQNPQGGSIFWIELQQANLEDEKVHKTGSM